MKKALITGLIFIVLVLLAVFGLFLYVMSTLFSTGIDENDRTDAINFCITLFDSPIIMESSKDYITFDDLPLSFRESAPKAIKNINFSLAGKSKNHICCFPSTEMGNQDWGYRDCLHEREDEDPRFAPQIKTIGGYSDCSGSGRHWHYFNGEKLCIQ